jgi:hypothetical protein
MFTVKVPSLILEISQEFTRWEQLKRKLTALFVQKNSLVGKCLPTTNALAYLLTLQKVNTYQIEFLSENFILLYFL